MSQPFQVGLFHLPVQTEYTQHYECAAWYQNHTVEAGDYPVMANWSTGHWYFYVLMPSVLGNSDFGTRLAGVPVGTTGYNENVGKSDTYTLSLGRDYDLARRLLTEAIDQHKSGVPHLTVDPWLVQLTVETYVSEHRIDLGSDPDTKYGHIDAEVPSWSVHARITVTPPTV